MAGTTGLEPATSAVTGQRSNQLSYVPKKFFNNLAKHHIEPNVSQLSLFFARFYFVALDEIFRPVWTPNKIPKQSKAVTNQVYQIWFPRPL